MQNLHKKRRALIISFGMSHVGPQPLFQAKYIILNVKGTFNRGNSKELLVWEEKGKRALRG